MYYLRTKPAAQAIQFTVDKTKLRSSVLSPASAGNRVVNGDANIPTEQEKNMVAMVCSLKNRDECLMCGS